MKKEFVLANILVCLAFALYLFTVFYSQTPVVYEGMPSGEAQVSLFGVPMWVPVSLLLAAGIYYAIKGIRKNPKHEV